MPHASDGSSKRRSSSAKWGQYLLIVSLFDVSVNHSAGRPFTSGLVRKKFYNGCL